MAGKPVSLLASVSGGGGAVGWGGGWQTCITAGLCGWGGCGLGGVGGAGKPVSLLASVGGGGAVGWGGVAGKPVSLLASVGGGAVGWGWVGGLANLYLCWPLWVGRAAGCGLGGGGALASLYYCWPLGRSLSSTAFQSLALKKKA